MEEEKVKAQYSFYWVKVIAFLQQNWAFLDIDIETKKTRILFVTDSRYVFDCIEFDTIEEAIERLNNNNFDWYLHPEKEHSNFLIPPKLPFRGDYNPIYSTGQYWK